MAFNEHLRELRTQKGLTQKALAEPRFTHAYVSSIEAGRKVPSVRAVRHFADKLGYPPDDLVRARDADVIVRLQRRLQGARRQLSRGDLAGAEAGFVGCLREARTAGIDRLQAGALRGLGLCADQGGDLFRAITHYEEAERILENDLTLKVEPLAGHASCLLRLGRVREAIFMLESTLSQLERADLSDPDALLRLHGSLAHAYVTAGLLDKAKASAESALALARHAQDPERLADMHLNVANVLLRERRFEDAHDSLRRAEDFYRELGLRLETAYAHHARGEVLNTHGERSEARVELHRALTLYQEIGDRMYEADCTTQLAQLERMEGNTAISIELLERALTLLGADGPPGFRANATRELALCDAVTDTRQAETRLREAMELFVAAEQPREVASTARILGDLLRANDEIVAAADAYRAGALAAEGSGIS